jgi:transposase-like protein
MPTSDIPSLRSLWSVFSTHDSSFEFLRQHDIFSIPISCEVCGGNVSIYGIKAQCTTRSCRKVISCLRNTFFSNSHLNLNETLLLGYLWLSGAQYSTAIVLTHHSPNTIVDYYSFFRQLVADSLDTEDWVIGGEGIVVEVDESKFGKRKYNRGKHVEGAWVIGGIERTPERKFFVTVVENRNHQTIVDVLSKHILPNSIVHSDCWKGYCGISEKLNVDHYTVNHEVGFVDNETGVHTNSIEGKWSALKQKITLRGRTKENLPDYLFEQIWRNRHENALWAGFISALREVYYE